MKISKIHARQILDSRGFPTVEADVVLEDGTLGRASVPSGASTGSGEALELRDGGTAYDGKGVTHAVKNVNEVIAPALIGQDASDQKAIDQTMLALDGTENKSNLGANAILSVSLAAAKASALAQKTPLYKYVGAMIGNHDDFKLPVPLMNLINGGKHAAGSTDIQEFMIVPAAKFPFYKRIQIGAEVFLSLKSLLAEKGYGTTVGDEGGFAPHVSGNEEALQLLVQAIERAGYQPGEDVSLALDVAASELVDGEKYNLKTESRELTSTEMTEWYEKLSTTYPIISIEDGLGEKDWDGWKKLTAEIGSKIQLVGDDLFVTNVHLLERGIAENAGNAILIKPNQIGTLTETIAAVQLAHSTGWNTIMSHRSGETEDTTIAHLAVGLKCSQIKTGSLSRSERLAKYNELLRIEEEIDS